MTTHEWTTDPETNRMNSSPLFLHLEKEIARIFRNHRVGDNPMTAAGVVLAQLAHVHNLAPVDAPAVTCADCLAIRKVDPCPECAALAPEPECPTCGGRHVSEKGSGCDPRVALLREVLDALPPCPGGDGCADPACYKLLATNAIQALAGERAR
jgi:hypothetical protein